MRYFIVFYTFTNDGIHIGGKGHETVKSLTFPSYNSFKKKIKSENVNIEDLCITNIIELTKKDYESWTK